MVRGLFARDEVINSTYRIEALLGQGATGEVYRAENVVTGRRVAIKVLRPEFARHEDYRELIRREEQIRDVVHPAVVRYTDVGQTAEGAVYLVMEHIDGPSLDAVLRRAPQKPATLMVIARRVAEGLAAAHAAGIVHRDLSPDNIVLREGRPDQAVIIDFGIAKDTRPGAGTVVGQAFAGKHEYAPPEQFSGRTDARSDLYALGATLLAAFRGAVPRMPEDIAAVIALKGRMPDLSGVPQPLAGLLSDLCQPDPDRRPPSAEAVIARIDAVGGAEGGRSRGRKGGRAAVLAVAALLLVGIPAGLLLWQPGLVSGLFASPPPVASPYTLAIERGADGALTVEGHVPGADDRDALLARLAQANGTRPEAAGLTLASGAPSPDVAALAGELAAALVPLGDWRLELTDRQVAATGLAPDRQTRRSVEARLTGLAGEAGFALARPDIALAPRRLPLSAVERAASAYGECGPPQVEPPADGAWALGEPVSVSAAVADRTSGEALRAALADVAGDRRVDLDLAVYNPPVCLLLRLLPDEDAEGVSLWFGLGPDLTANLTGVYAIGDNPVIDVLAPADSEGLHLHVIAADVTGQVFSLLPNIYRTETRIERLGAVEAGVRRIRVAFTSAERLADSKVIAFEIDPTFGETIVAAFLSPEPLFDEIRPIAESAESFTEALERRLAGLPPGRVAIAHRFLTTRGE